jgi:membrane protein involved in colicin uptake
MRKVEKELKDRTDSEGNPITVFATEILEGEDGQAIIAQPSPLTEKFKMTIEQFSVTSSDYDAETLQQFAEKKKAYLAAERSKAERESAVQERLMIQEQGLRDKTEAEAIANVDKAKAVIAAELKAEVALQTKIEAETKANQLLEVAKIEKEEAETKASMDLEVAKVQAEAAMENKKAMIAEAEGKQQAIELSGAITELEQAKIDAEVKIMSEFARSIPMMQSPSTVFSGGNGAGNEGSSTLQNNMMSLVMLKMIGGDNFADFGKVKSVSNRQIRESIPTDTNIEVAKK